MSDRDIESLIAEAGLGHVSKRTVSEITQQLRARYQAFRARSLGEVRLLVWYLDATYLAIRPSGPKAGVLVVWGYDDWLEMGRTLIRRGLRSLLLVVTDGAPGLVRSIEELWPDADRQRCTVHVLRNIVAELPKKDDELRKRVEAAYWAAVDEAGSAAEGEDRLRRLVGERFSPSAAACLAADLAALCVHLSSPLRLRRRLRSTNLLERLLEEVKRRTELIGRLTGKTSCLSLCWAVLDLFIAAARGLGQTSLEQRELTLMWAARMMQTPESWTA